MPSSLRTSLGSSKRSLSLTLDLSVRRSHHLLLLSIAWSHPSISFLVLRLTADDKCTTGIKIPSSWIFSEGSSRSVSPPSPSSFRFTFRKPRAEADVNFFPPFSFRFTEDDSCGIEKQETIIAHHKAHQPEGSFESHRYMGTVHGFASRPALHVPEVKKVS